MRLCQFTLILTSAIFIFPLVADERLLLMQDVEALYREAVATQEAMMRKKQHLENQRQAAQTLLDQRRLLAQELDEQIAALAAERGRAEEALCACQASLEGAFTHVAEQTRDHEALLTALQREEQGLQDRLVALSQQERALADKVEALHTQRDHRGLRTAASAAAHRLGKSEMLLAEHLSHISGSTSASVKANKVMFAHTPQHLPERSHVSDVSFPATAAATSSSSVGDALQKDRAATAAAAEERRRALLLSGTSIGVGAGKENNYSGVADRTSRTEVASSKTPKISAYPGATTTSVKTGTTTTKGANKNDKGEKKKGYAGRDSQKTVPPSVATNNHNDASSQEDVDRQIEALSLRIRQRLTNI